MAYFAFRAARRSSGANKNEKSESFDWLANKTSKLYDWFFVDAIAIYTIYLGLGIVLSSIFIISAWRLSMLFPSELFDSLMNIFTLNMIESSELRIVLSGLLWMLIAQGFCKLLRIDKVLEQMVRKRLHA
nr:hypothetical protein [Candidatus Burarchaeum sp.]